MFKTKDFYLTLTSRKSKVHFHWWNDFVVENVRWFWHDPFWQSSLLTSQLYDSLILIIHSACPKKMTITPLVFNLPFAEIRSRLVRMFGPGSRVRVLVVLNHFISTSADRLVIKGRVARELPVIHVKVPLGSFKKSTGSSPILDKGGNTALQMKLTKRLCLLRCRIFDMIPLSRYLHETSQLYDSHILIIHSIHHKKLTKLHLRLVFSQ
jgi:hypothetical protein